MLSSLRRQSPESRDDGLDDSDFDDVGDHATPNPASADHHSYIFGYRSVDIDLSMCLPEPFHVPYLWSTYQENVEPLLKVVHVPTMKRVFRDARKKFDQLTPGYQALVWAIYYGAVVSLEPEDVLSNLGQSKDEALARYRFAVQHALSRAGFLHTADITVLQAFSIFLSVVRHQDESRFCWSMTGLAIHLARGMGLHRDGSHLALSPFEREIRRRLWWGLMHLDLRSAEELGTDLIVGDSTFDTHMPSNINDIDISPEISESPKPREGRTDTTLFLVRCEICSLSRRVIEASSTSSTVEEQKTMLVEVYQRIDQMFFKWIDATDPSYDMAAMLSRSVRAKICFVIYQSVVFPEAGTQSDLSDEAQQCVYSAAVNLLEYDHTLNADPQYQQYRWLFQTFTNWHATAYFLIESCRRPWTPLVERGWQALHGYQERNTDYIKSPAHESVVLPIRSLWLRVSKHRAQDIARLSENLEEAHRLDYNERTIPVIFPFGDNLGGEDHMMDLSRARWNAMLRADSSAIPTRSVQPPSLQQTVASCLQTQTPKMTEAGGSSEAELCEGANCLSGRTVCQSPGCPVGMSWPLHLVGWPELGEESTGQSSDEVQARSVDMIPQQTRLPIESSYPPSWLGSFLSAAVSSEEGEGADIDIFSSNVF